MHRSETLHVEMLGTRGLPNRYGGSETCVEEVGTRLARAGHHVRVFSRSRVTGTRAREYRGLVIAPMPSLPAQVLDTLSHSLAAILWLAVRRKRHAGTVLHFHGSGNGALLPLTRLLGLPAVVTVDGADWRREKWGPIARRLLKLAAGMTGRLADVVVADSREGVQTYRRMWGSEPEYIPYGAPEWTSRTDRSVLERFGLQPRSYLLFVGRFVPEKQIHVLVEAHRLLPAPRPKLVLVGGLPDESNYARRVGAATSEDVVFTGKLYGDELAPLLDEALAYVQPSSVEGTSPMVLTAMAHGLPVVASEIPENRETLGSEGIFFAVGDFTKLSEAISSLLADEQAREERGRRLAERARTNFSWDEVTRSYERAYRLALARRR